MQCIFIVNSAIVNECTGNVSVDNAPQTINDEESEILRILRRIPVRERVELMRIVYEYEDKSNNQSADNGPLFPCQRTDTPQSAEKKQGI